MVFLLKITVTDFEHASRDKREISVVRELGYDVEVIAKSNNGISKIGEQDDYKVHYLSTRLLGDSKHLVKLNRLISIFYWSNYVRKLNATCISGHNLEAAIIGWLSNRFKKNKAALVYDPHEYTLETKEKSRLSKLYRLFVFILEKFIINKSEFTITVNDSIAEALMRDYNLPQKPLVVRNVANYWHIDPLISSQIREKICDNINMPLNTFIVMYHGAVMKERGIENLISSAKISGDDVAVVILGYGEATYKKDLSRLACDLGVKVYFHDAVHVSDLWKYISAVDAGVSLGTNSCTNHYFMLPNKIFENIQSLTPLIASNYPEIRNIIKGYSIGVCCDASNTKSISDSIKRLKDNKNFYSVLKRNLVVAKSELSWENEKIILKNAYSKIFDNSIG